MQLTFNKWLEKFKLTKLKINLKFIEAEFIPTQLDKDASWEMYIELMTRITTQKIKKNAGDEKIALSSIYIFFKLTRKILKKHKGCIEFSKIAIVVLNQIIRPFTAKWHKISLDNGFKNQKYRKIFRKELKILQKDLINYSMLLLEMADVEDLNKTERTK